MIPLPQCTFGRYQLLEQLASGPRAVVLRARDPGADRVVALKIFHMASGDEVSRAFVARCFRDLEAAADLSHPNLVRIYDFGELEGHPFVAMELCEGPLLAPLLRRSERPPFARAFTLVAEVARALDLAHQRDLLHGNLKPSNLIFHDGVLKVTDFGAIHLDHALPMEPEAAADALRYRAPEQLRDQDLDGRTDEFSIGVLFYQLVTGVYPFPGKGGPGARDGREEPSPPRWWNPALPIGIDGICARVLAREPSERYPNCLAFAHALEHMLSRQGQRERFIPPPEPGQDDAALAVARLESLAPLPSALDRAGPVPIRPRELPGRADVPVVTLSWTNPGDEVTTGILVEDPDDEQSPIEAWDAEMPEAPASLAMKGAATEVLTEALEAPGDEELEAGDGAIAAGEAVGEDHDSAGVIEAAGAAPYEEALDPTGAGAIEMPDEEGLEVPDGAAFEPRPGSARVALRGLEAEVVPVGPAPEDELPPSPRPADVPAPLPWMPRTPAARRQPIVAQPPPVEEWALIARDESFAPHPARPGSSRRDSITLDPATSRELRNPAASPRENTARGPFTPPDVLPPGEDPELAALIAANLQGTAPRLPPRPHPPAGGPRPPGSPSPAPDTRRSRLRTLGYMLISAVAAVAMLHFFGPDTGSSSRPAPWPIIEKAPPVPAGPADPAIPGSVDATRPAPAVPPLEPLDRRPEQPASITGEVPVPVQPPSSMESDTGRDPSPITGEQGLAPAPPGKTPASPKSPLSVQVLEQDRGPAPKVIQPSIYP